MLLCAEGVSITLCAVLIFCQLYVWQAAGLQGMQECVSTPLVSVFPFPSLERPKG